MTSLLDENLLRTFVEAARHGSFSRAATALVRTQAAVTLQIRRLEDVVGQQLFIRTTRGVSLTSAGVEFLPYAERILSLGTEAQRFMSQHQMPISERPRRIGLIEDLSSMAVLDRGLASIRKHFDPVKIGLNFESGRLAEEAFNTGELDMLVGDRFRSPAGGAAPVSSITVPLAWMASPEFDPFQRPLPLALYEAPCIWRELTVACLDASLIASTVAVESRGMPALLSALRSGTAVAALLPASVGSGLISLDYLAAGLPRPPKVEIVLYQSRHAVSDPVIKNLSDVLWRSIQDFAVPVISP